MSHVERQPVPHTLSGCSKAPAAITAVCAYYIILYLRVNVSALSLDCLLSAIVQSTAWKDRSLLWNDLLCRVGPYSLTHSLCCLPVCSLLIAELASFTNEDLRFQSLFFVILLNFEGL